MSRIVPQYAKSSVNDKPEWLDMSEISKAAGLDKEKNEASLKKTASFNSQATKITITTYACQVCGVTYPREHKALKTQATIAQRSSAEVDYKCPKCGDGLVPYAQVERAAGEITTRSGDLVEKRVDLSKEGTGTYNTFTDRMLVGRGQDALRTFAQKMGMYPSEVHYKKAEHSKQAGQEYPMLNKMTYVIDWHVLPKYRISVEAELSVDQAGKFVMPRVFKTADQKEYPFDKQLFKDMAKQAQSRHMSERKPKKTDMLNYRKADPSNFRPVASLVDSLVDGELGFTSSVKKKSELSSTANAPGVMAQPGSPTTPTITQQPGQGFQPNQPVINPLDNKEYMVKQVNPDGSVTLGDGTTGQDAVVKQQDAGNLRPVVKTTELDDCCDEDSVLLGVVDTIDPSEFENHVRKDIDHERQEIVEKLDSVKNDIDAIIENREMLPTTSGKIAHTTRSTATLTNPNIGTAAKTWHELRKSLSFKHGFNAEEPDPTKETREVRAQRELGFSPTKPKKDKTGHDASGVPLTEDKEVTLGLTDFPIDVTKSKKYEHPEAGKGKGYAIPFKEMEENQVKNREQFRNKEKLPVDHMTREEYRDMLGKKDPDDNYGLGDMEVSALSRAVGIQKRAFPDEPVAPEKSKRPIIYKDVKKAPAEKDYPGFKEPAVIEEAGGQVSEAITKLRQVQEKLAELEEELKKKQAGYTEKLKPLQEDISKHKDLQKSYIEMAYNMLMATKDNVRAYEEAIYASVNRDVTDSGPAVTLPQVIEAAKAISEEFAQQIQSVVEKLKGGRATDVEERFLFKYPASGVQQKKITALAGVESVFIDIVKILSELNGRLADELSLLTPQSEVL